MENQDSYNNNHRLRGQQEPQYHQLGSRADRAPSWRSSQRDPIPGTPIKKRRNNVGGNYSADVERLNILYKSTCQRDDRVSSWCNDVQRHHLSDQTSYGFSVFNDSQLNQPLPVQPGVGAHLNPRDPPSGLLLSPFLQSMHLPSPVSAMQIPSASSPAMHFTSADLRASSSILFQPPDAGSQMVFNQGVPESVHSSQSFSPWSNNANALQLRDSNQQNLFNSSFMSHKHCELGIKADATCKPNSPPSSNTSKLPTWSQIAAKGPQELNRRMSSTTVATAKASESRVSTVQAERTISTNALLKEDMDLDMPEVKASPEPAGAPVASPIRESRYITDSLAFISSGVNNDQNISVVRHYTVLKIKNITWNVSASDIYDTLSRYKAFSLPNAKKLPQCIHVFMDVKTGKTLNTAYVELEMNTSSQNQIDSLVRSISIPQAQGRHISVTRSSYDELCNDLFSGWKGEFVDGLACPHTDSRDSSATQKSQYYIGQRDLQRLLNVCRFFKTYYNRKCAERPFEYLITIIMNMPWKQPHAVTTAQRDIVYECYKLATEALYKHVHRPYHSFDDELLPRMVRAAVICDGFTVRQKKVVLGNAKMECPPDLESYMQEPILNTAGFTDFLR
ncbi:hypothetical protein PS15p_204696 [Mucor circinelloides]